MGDPKWVVITPEMAAEMLERNTHNRRLRQGKVDQYTEDMNDGRWSESPDAILIGKDGKLLNGQHRLWAIVQSGKAQRMLVIDDAEDEIQEVLDSGASRTLADALMLRGDKYPHAISGAISLFWRYSTNRIQLTYAKLPTRRGLLAFHDEHREGFEMSAVIQSRFNVLAGSPIRLMPSVMGTFTVALYEIGGDMDEYAVFLDSLRTGEMLGENDPILALRERLMQETTEANANRMGRRGSRSDQWRQLAYMIKAWNAWTRGESLERLMLRLGGSHPEAFPKLESGREDGVVFVTGEGVVKPERVASVAARQAQMRAASKRTRKKAAAAAADEVA